MTALELGMIAHVGIVVPDIEAARGELGRALGLRFAPVAEQMVEGRAASVVSSTPVRLTWSVEGPPHVELLQGPAGTVWAAEDGPRLHHIGYWAEDVVAASTMLEASGLPLEMGGVGAAEPEGFAYHLAGDVRVEILDARRKRALERWLAGS